MSIDDRMLEAGSRLREVSVHTPSPVSVRDRIRRRRNAGRVALAAMFLVLGALTASLVALDARGGSSVDDVASGSAIEAPPDHPIGLRRDAFWPPDGQEMSDPVATASSFAAEVLGWSDNDVEIDETQHGGIVLLTITSSRGDEVRVVATESDSGWILPQIGVDTPINVTTPQDSTEIMDLIIDAGPDPSTTLRWWSLTADGESGPHEYPGASATIPLESTLEDLHAVLVVYLDDDGLAVGATGSLFPF